MRWGAAYYVRIDFEGDVANELDLFKAVFEHLNSINLEAHGGTVPSMHITELESHRLIDGRPVPVDQFYELPQDPEAVTDTAVFVQDIAEKADDG